MDSLTTSKDPELEVEDDNLFHEAEKTVTRKNKKGKRKSNINQDTEADKPSIVAIEGNVQAFHDVAITEIVKAIVIAAAAIYLISIFDNTWPLSILFTVLVIKVLKNKLESLKDDFALQIEHQALQHYGKQLDGESVDWLNGILHVMWPQINPDLFVPIVDLLEDTMQYIAPKALIQSVRIEDFNLGTNPLKILSMRTYPDPDSPNTFNIEASFSYRRLSSPTAHESNIHFHVYLGTGIKKLVGITIPCYVELRGTVGEMHIRVETVPDPPFITNTTVSFPVKPAVHVVAKPLGILDVMNLPLISQYVLSSVNTVLYDFVQPRSYTLDLGRLILGPNMLYKTHHLGVIYILIESASDLPVSDASGKSDPYVSVSYSRFEKPLYSTRIIKRDLNPSWMESCFVKVGPEHMQANEQLRLSIWDSDRYSSDDTLGIIEIPIDELVNNPGKAFVRYGSLQPRYSGTRTKGTVSWTVGYYPITKFEQVDDTTKKPFTSENIAENIPKVLSYYSNEAKMCKSPPIHNANTAILAFQIHQMEGLEIPNTHGARPYNDLDDSLPPSSFSLCFLNDEKIYKTRAKKYSSNPYINSGTEVVVKDWKDAVFTLAVLESRMREHDPVIGMVNLNLSELFQDTCEVTTWYPLQYGIGYGSVRVSLLLRTLDIDIPKQLRGANIGTLQINKMSVKSMSDDQVEVTIKTHSGTKLHIDGLFPGDINNFEQDDRVLNVPLVKRYQYPVRFELRKFNRIISKTGWIGEAILWMSSMPDNEVVTIDLPVYKDPNWRSVRQNCWQQPEYYPKTLKSNPEEHQHLIPEDKTPLGTDCDYILSITMTFIPGFGPNHGTIVDKHTKSIRQAYKVYEWREITTKSTHLYDEASSTGPRKSSEDWYTEPESPAFTRFSTSTRRSDVDTRFSLDTMNTQARFSMSERRNHNALKQNDLGKVGAFGQFVGRKKRSSALNSKLQRGIYHVKPVRTISWAKDSTRMGLRRLSHSMSHKGKQPTAEKEVLSSF